MIEHIFFGLIAVGLGVLSMKYNFQLVNFTGSVGFVEQYLGAGSTYVFFKFLSLVLIIGGFLYMTGLGTPVLDWLLSPLRAFFPSNSTQ